jgi:hypothetical protein
VAAKKETLARATVVPVFILNIENAIVKVRTLERFIGTFGNEKSTTFKTSD